MDEAQVRQLAEEYAKAVERADLPAITSDFVPELHPRVPEIGASLPRPVETGEVLSVEAHDDHAIVQIRYSGPESAVTIQTRWEDRGERPLIVDGAPVE